MISVVIPAYNAERFIRRTIDSVLAQTYRDFELIVVDDGSTDDTREVVESYGSRVCYIYQKNAGDGPARNTGIAAAKGEWIAFLDHDDEWLPNKLELQVALLERNPELRWCGANFERSCLHVRQAAGDTEKLTQTMAGRDYFDNFFTAVATQGCALVTMTMIVHREVFEQVGVFDSCWALCADFDMWWRITYRFPKIGYLPQPLGIMHLDAMGVAAARYHLAGKSGDDARRLVEKHLKLAEANGMLAEFTPLGQKVLRKSLATNIFHGLKADARNTARQFPTLLPWHLRGVAFLLTVFPKPTSAAMRCLVHLAYRLGLKRDASRGRLYVKKADG
ncbi:MAG: glycosyltransferase [Sedimentisphaerales bacterium]|nr:glycosyltransferase [Sedimentisphaerales bacterium]